MCRHPAAPTLSYPTDGQTSVFNKDVVLTWEEVTSSMIGTPCSSVYSVPVLNVIMNSATEMQASGSPTPYKVVMNISALSSESLPIGFNYYLSNLIC